jgi:copper chaperone CopZ
MQPISSLLLLADAAAPAGTAASSKVGVAIVVLVFAIVFALAVRAALRHFKGEGGCCGGGAGAPPPVADKAIGPAVARRELALDGLHCMKCVARVKAALEALPGVAADVTLDPQRAIVRMDREVPDESLRKAVENQGFQVLSIA